MGNLIFVIHIKEYTILLYNKYFASQTKYGI